MGLLLLTLELGVCASILRLFSCLASMLFMVATLFYHSTNWDHVATLVVGNISTTTSEISRVLISRYMVPYYSFVIANLLHTVGYELTILALTVDPVLGYSVESSQQCTSITFLTPIAASTFVTRFTAICPATRSNCGIVRVCFTNRALAHTRLCIVA